MVEYRTALVTGATQGLGLALVEGLAARLGPEDLVLLTGRNPEQVAEHSSRIARLPGSRTRVEGRIVDVTDPVAVQRLADELDSVDLVFSNAGVRMTPDRAAEDQIDDVVESYNLGAIRMLRSFVPLLRPGGRFLVVASSFGRLGHLPPALRPRFDDATSLADLEEVLRSWRAAVHAGTAGAEGWPRWLNVPSKVAQVAAVRVVARERREQDRRDGTLICAVCPGLIDTAASRPWFDDMSGAQTPPEAAGKVLDLALGDAPTAFHGELVQFGRVLPWRGDIPSRFTTEARASRAAG